MSTGFVTVEESTLYPDDLLRFSAVIFGNPPDDDVSYLWYSCATTQTFPHNSIPTPTTPPDVGGHVWVPIEESLLTDPISMTSDVVGLAPGTWTTHMFKWEFFDGNGMPMGTLYHAWYFKGAFIYPYVGNDTDPVWFGFTPTGGSFSGWQDATAYSLGYSLASAEEEFVVNLECKFVDYDEATAALDAFALISDSLTTSEFQTQWKAMFDSLTAVTHYDLGDKAYALWWGEIPAGTIAFGDPALTRTISPSIGTPSDGIIGSNTLGDSFDTTDTDTPWFFRFYSIDPLDTSDPEATYTVRLQLTGGYMEGTATVAIGDVLEPPTAIIEATQLTVNPGVPITFDGAESYDLDGSIVSYAWSVEQADADGPTDPLTGTSSSITASFSQVGTYEVSLTVTDNDGLTDATIVTVTVVLPTVTEATASQPILLRRT